MTLDQLRQPEILLPLTVVFAAVAAYVFLPAVKLAVDSTLARMFSRRSASADQAFAERMAAWRRLREHCSDCSAAAASLDAQLPVIAQDQPADVAEVDEGGE